MIKAANLHYLLPTFKLVYCLLHSGKFQHWGNSDEHVRTKTASPEEEEESLGTSKFVTRWLLVQSAGLAGIWEQEKRE